MNQRTIYLKPSENNCETVKIIKGVTKIDKCPYNRNFFIKGINAGKSGDLPDFPIHYQCFIHL